MCDDEAEEASVLTNEEEKRLNSVSVSVQYDATFVRILLEILYKDDIKILSHRSFTGKTSKGEMATNDESGNSNETVPFKAISPRKKSDIITLFKKRIANAGTNKQDQFNRLRSANITRLVGAGITNIRKRN